MSGDNYIGSKISLISLSDIRYVGVLHSINPLDSTVGLKQVRSFGTEGRRGKPEEEILPSDNVFDYVVFRGSDIKDLQVFEAPPKPATPQPSLPQDPAIMSMSSYPPMNSYGGNNGYMPQPPVQPAAAAVVPTPQQQQQPAHQAPPSMTKQSPLQSSQNYWQQPSPYSPKNTTTIDSQQQQQLKQQQQHQQQFQKKKQIEDQQAKLERDTLEELKAELDESHAMQPTINEAAIEQLAKKVSELNTGDDVIIKEDQQQQQQQPRLNNNNNNNNNRRYDNNSNNNNNNNNNNQRRNNNRYQYNNKTKNNNDFSIPTSEFDFEASNAKFNKDEIVKKNEEDQEEEEEVSIPEADNFYNKTSSFFDNISCESKERNERQVNEPRRSHFQEERKLNLETFGQATVDQSRYRNNYRGRGGNRGGNRGGYYRNNNSNNSTTTTTNNNNNNNRNNYNNNNGFRQNKDQQQEAN